MDMQYRDRLGRSISVCDWSDLFADQGYRMVRQTSHDGLLVSTVWVGIALEPSWPAGIIQPRDALIFETMIFDRDVKHGSGWRDLGCWRWSTEVEADAGHELVCAGVFADIDEADLDQFYGRGFEPAEP